jgi:preprotein translocase subunit SecB
MNSSPLELERYFFTKVEVVAVAESTSHQPNVSATVALAEKVDDKRRFLVQVNVAIGANPGENPNYQGSISIVGYFKVHPKYSGDPAELAGVNGASILFAAGREMVANITARGPWPTLMLPCVSFQKELSPKTKGRASKGKRVSAAHRTTHTATTTRK